MTPPTPVLLTGDPLTPAQVERVARHAAPVSLAPPARQSLERARDALQRAMQDGQPHYGCNTGFGAFARTRIPDDQLSELQHNLIRSHAAGAGPLLPADAVRAMLLLLAASLSRGRSGVRPALVEAILSLLNAGVTPAVPAIGSVGASGDLAPLAHAALSLLGEGDAFLDNEPMTSADALARAGLQPITLEAKEGLALINGTHLMAARLALLSQDIAKLENAAIAAAALSLDAAKASHAPLDPRVYDARNQPGPARVAGRLRALLEGSAIAESHKENDPRVQDPYSFRCAPIILGSAITAINDARRALESELGAVTDNPLVLESAGDAHALAEILSAGNFHGMPVAIPLDTLPIALAHLAGAAERRTYHILSGFDELTDLPKFLSPTPGLHSGLMIAQYTAAACCNEIITLATPASVSNLSTSAGVEDYNSFGPRAAAQATDAVDRARTVVAVELLVAAEALRRHHPLTTGRAAQRVLEEITSIVPPFTADRPVAPDIAAIESLIAETLIAQ